jgi:hypothetical protein
MNKYISADQVTLSLSVYRVIGSLERIAEDTRLEDEFCTFPGVGQCRRAGDQTQLTMTQHERLTVFKLVAGCGG